MIIRGTRVFTGEGDGKEKFTEADVRILDGRIAGIGKDLPDREPAEEICELNGCKLIPGPVDIHTHGRIGLDFTTASESEIHTMLENYLHSGVTGVLATIMTNDRSILISAFERVNRVISKQQGACDEPGENLLQREATVYGINFEGVWLSPEKRGAHLLEYLELPSVKTYEEFDRASGGNIRLATIAPELEGAMELISLKKDRTHFSLGHSKADYARTIEAINAGADHATHLFNAMPPFGHREPGLAGAALDRHIYTEVICDGYHVHPAVIRTVFNANANRTVLISDSIAPAGLENGVYTSGGQPVTAKDGKILTMDGTIAGSGIDLFEGLKRCVTRFEIEEDKAVRAATLNAAESVGIGDIAGSIRMGRNADMIVVDDAYNIIDVIKNGVFTMRKNR